MKNYKNLKNNNMEKIKLTPREKEIIIALANNTYKLDAGSKDSYELQHLDYLGLCEGLPCEFGGYLTFKLAPKAKAYLFENPKLLIVYNRRIF